MSINLKDAVDFLLQEGYIYKAIKHLKFTPKAYKELDMESLDKRLRLQAEEVRKAWDARYIQFIRDAEVPQRGEGSDGSYYALNKYTVEGETALRRALETGTSYPRLVASTKLYYKSGIKLKVAIGRYMKEGLWRTDYEALAQAEEEGNSSEHVKQQTSNGTHTAWQVG